MESNSEEKGKGKRQPVALDSGSASSQTAEREKRRVTADFIGYRPLKALRTKRSKKGVTKGS